MAGIGTYDEMAKDLKATGLSDVANAAALQSLVATGIMPGVPPDAAPLLSRLQELMFGRESVRNTGNVVMAPMTLDLVKEGKMSFDDAFAEHEDDPGRVGKRGEFPMSMEKAAAARRE